MGKMCFLGNENCFRNIFAIWKMKGFYLVFYTLARLSRYIQFIIIEQPYFQIIINASHIIALYTASYLDPSRKSCILVLEVSTSTASCLGAIWEHLLFSKWAYKAQFPIVVIYKQLSNKDFKKIPLKWSSWVMRFRTSKLACMKSSA